MKRLYFIPFILVFYIIISSQAAFAQFVATTTVNAAVSPTTLVQNDLLGVGITVSNITTNIPGGADPRQFARFTNANSALPFSSGIMLSSGFADSYNNNGNTATGFGNDLFGAGDANLNVITAPSTTFDAAVLEFDFVPLSDTVRFRYVFASEEYPEYACADVNDAFGFFISGPGIAGTQNIATATGAEAAFFDYVVKNGTNVSAGTITAATDGTNVEYNETSTADLGDTSDIKLKVVLSSGDLILQATAVSDNWNVSSFIKYMAL